MKLKREGFIRRVSITFQVRSIRVKGNIETCFGSSVSLRIVKVLKFYGFDFIFCLLLLLLFLGHSKITLLFSYRGFYCLYRVSHMFVTRVSWFTTLWPLLPVRRFILESRGTPSVLYLLWLSLDYSPEYNGKRHRKSFGK